MSQLLNCPNCGASVPAENINIQDTLAVCSTCDRVFDFGSKFTPKKRKPRKIKPPETVELIEQDERYEIQYRWYTPLAWGIVPVAIFWNLFMLFWHGSTVFGGWLIGTLFAIPHTLIGLWLIYKVLTAFINRTRIVMTPYDLAVMYGPIPSPGSRLIDRRSIEGLYIKEDSTETINNRKTPIYGLYMETKGDKDRAVVKGVRDYTLALFIKQEIDAYFLVDDEEGFIDETHDIFLDDADWHDDQRSG